MMMIVRAGCPNCGATVHVMPPEIFAVVEGLAGGSEAALTFATQLSELTDENGDRFTARDDQGFFTCPACSTRQLIPPSVTPN